MKPKFSTRLGIMLILLSLLALPLAAHAQDPLTQSYTSQNGAVTFNYPADWFAGQFQEEIFLSNEQAGLDAATPSDLDSGVFLMDILADPSIMSLLGIPAGSAPIDYYSVLSSILVENFGLPEVPAQPADVTIAGQPGVRGEASGISGDAFLVVFDMGGGLLGASFAFSQSGELATFLPTIEAVLETVAFKPPLNLTYTSTDGATSFKYPLGWVTDSLDETQVVLTNSIDAMMSPDMAPGMVIAFVLSPEFFVRQFGVPEGAEPAEALGTFIEFIEERRAGEVDFGAPTPINKGTVVEARSSTADQDAVLWGIDAGGDLGTVAVYAFALSGELAQFEPTLLQILETVTYDPPPPPVVNGAIIWQTQGEVVFSGDNLLGNLGGMTVGADDTIYIADGPNGIQVVSPDGELQGSFKSPDVLFAFDVALDDDGNLWVTDSAAHALVQLDAQGNTLQSFGEVGTDVGQFGENTDSPTLIEFGPDGNLYVYAKQLVPGGNQETFGFVQVWTTDGRFLGQFSTQPPSLEPFTSPVDMDFGPDGSLYMVNADGIIRIFDDQGNVVRSETDFRLIYKGNSLAVGPEGDIYIGALGGAVYHYSAQGEYIEQFGNPQPTIPSFPSRDPYEEGDFTAPTAIAVLSNGDLIITDTNFSYSQIVRFSFSSGRPGVSGQ